MLASAVPLNYQYREVVYEALPTMTKIIIQTPIH